MTKIASYFIAGLLFGWFITVRFLTPDQKSQEPLTKVEYKTKIVKVTEPSGKVTETKTIEKKRDELPRQELKKYSVSILGLKELSAIQADARLGNMPLFAGAQISKDKVNLVLRYEF